VAAVPALSVSRAKAVISRGQLIEERLMKSWLQKILTASKAAPRAALRQRYRATLEPLEDRLALSRIAVIDFDGPTISAQRFTDGQWQNQQAAVNFASFRGMFVAGANAVLDIDGNGTVNASDADLAISRIVSRVRQDYAPYDLSIRTGSFADNVGRLTDAQVGDVLVVATGGSDFRTGQNAFGVAPWSDMGNEHDEIVFGFGSSIAGASVSSAEFINRMARTISHEAGHAFGLGHVIPDAALTNADMLDAQTHHLMAAGVPRDFTHDFTFQDLTFNTDVRQFRFSESVLHPELNDDAQNSHRYLSNAAVLGAATGPWLAMLKPGELTIHGSIGTDSLTLIESSVGAQTFLTFVQVSMISVSPLLPPVQVVMAGTLNGTAVAGESFTLNPYDKAMFKVIADSGNSNDTINAAGLTTIRLFAFGGAGQDSITGGRADDELHGGLGNDTVRGGLGNDRLFGDAGLDQLFGDEGADRLDGGADGARDILFGHNLTTPDDNAVDTFVRHLRLGPTSLEIEDERDRATNDNEVWMLELGNFPF
jgi:Ca2+-binding RTX toxin-like protein